MSLTGNLETMGLPEVLQWIATSRKTGTLYLRRAITLEEAVSHSSEPEELQQIIASGGNQPAPRAAGWSRGGRE